MRMGRISRMLRFLMVTTANVLPVEQAKANKDGDDPDHLVNVELLLIGAIPVSRCGPWIDVNIVII